MGISLTEREVNVLLYDLQNVRQRWQTSRIYVDNSIFGFWIRFSMSNGNINHYYAGRVIGYDPEDSSLFMVYLDDEVAIVHFILFHFFNEFYWFQRHTHARLIQRADLYIVVAGF